MKKLIVLFAFFSPVLASAFPVKADPGLDTIRGRIVAQLMEPEADDGEIHDLINTLQEDGSWPGINYEDTSRTGFQHSIHMANLGKMSRAYRKKSSGFFNSRQLKAAFDTALDYWLTHDFICENWWWNQIGVPGQLAGILLIMEEDNFTEEQWEQSLKIAGRANLDASGARPSGDRIKIAGILAKTLLAVKDSARFNEVIEVIEGEIKFATGRGMQYDYSFHHRTDRVNNTLSYGTGYADTFAEWAAYVSGTSYAFSPASLKLLTDYYLDGICKMMVFGKYPDPGAKNRGISRKGSLKAFGTSTPVRLLKASEYRAEELQAIVANREGKKGAIHPHTTFFWHSEHFTHQRPGYFTSVRMFSTRNHNMEIPYNSEGLLNHYLGNGSNFISRTGKEYYDIFPVFDFHKIPGATLVQTPLFPGPGEIQKAGITGFVGGVTDGIFGAAAFDFQSIRDSVKARKAWFFFDKEYACLGTGISSEARSPVATTINQSLLNGEVIVLADGKRSAQDTGKHQPGKVKWVWHDSIGYVFPDFQDVHLSNAIQTGSWYRINQQSDSPKDPVSKEVFKLWLDHGSRPGNASYAYFVVPGASQEDIARFSDHTAIKILANNSRVQAVEHTEMQLSQLAFYAADTIGIAGNISIAMESPGMLMIRRNGTEIEQITVSDPSRKLSRIHFSVNRKIDTQKDSFRTHWNPGKKITEISIDLPAGVYAGKSVVIGL